MKPNKRRAVSPVIATVIIVAVTITVAVAVAYWMSGIASQYTAFEKVEIQTAICSWDGESGSRFEWVIEIKLKNTGTASSTLTNVFINEVEVNSYGHTIGTTWTAVGEGLATTNMTETTTIESGATVVIIVLIDGPGDATTDGRWRSVSAGTTVNIKIHSANGMDYIKLVKLT